MADTPLPPLGQTPGPGQQSPVSGNAPLGSQAPQDWDPLAGFNQPQAPVSNSAQSSAGSAPPDLFPGLGSPQPAPGSASVDTASTPTDIWPPPLPPEITPAAAATMSSHDAMAPMSSDFGLPPAQAGGGYPVQAQSVSYDPLTSPVSVEPLPPVQGMTTPVAQQPMTSEFPAPTPIESTQAAYPPVSSPDPLSAMGGQEVAANPFSDAHQVVPPITQSGGYPAPAADPISQFPPAQAPTAQPMAGFPVSPAGSTAYPTVAAMPQYNQAIDPMAAPVNLPPTDSSMPAVPEEQASLNQVVNEAPASIPGSAFQAAVPFNSGPAPEPIVTMTGTESDIFAQPSGIIPAQDLTSPLDTQGVPTIQQSALTEDEHEELFGREKLSGLQKAIIIIIAVVALGLVVGVGLWGYQRFNGGAPVQSASKELDTDGDGLSDTDETARGTNPNDADTDGDGYRDGDEVAGGYDPLVKPAE